jgi:hypothetical protein
MIIVGLRVSCVLGLPVWSWERRLLEALFNITRMGNTSVGKRVPLSIARHAGDAGIASGRASIPHDTSDKGGKSALYVCMMLQRYGYNDFEPGARGQPVGAG